MTYTYPDFYFDFQCKASACRHSCCRGWEIDIDDESLRRYETMCGVIGEKLRASIAYEPTPHFVLDDGENCPFLQKDGLCELIVRAGEESLCDICAEHPRFYHNLSDRMEAGLGLCCEAVARLVMSGDRPWYLVEECDEGETPAAEEEWLLTRNRIIAQLQEGDLDARMRETLTQYGTELLPFDKEKWIAHFRSLERMDPVWDEALGRLEQSEIFLEENVNKLQYARLAAYFVYRHIEGPEDMAARLQFAFLSARMVCALEACGVADAARLYSAEIEYSDENVQQSISFCKIND